MSARKAFYISSAIVLILIALLSLLWKDFLWLYVIAGPLFVIGLYDCFQQHHTILRNFPLLGRFRYMAEFIAPEIHQYFIESDHDGRPINRERRSIVYERAKGTMDTLPFGTRWDVYVPGYAWLNHSMQAKFLKDLSPRVMIGSAQCRQPYSASILNVSAMSFGALSPEAVMSINRGAQEGGFYQNTGEGGLTPYHLKYKGDLVWQIGTAYFGCRTPEGDFWPDAFKDKATLPSVKMIEIKISQGAKPGHGGILPADKVTKEIAEIRGVRLGEDVISPPVHSTFKTPIEMMAFIARLRELAEGKPIGFKLCIGSRPEFFAICKAIVETGILPDFITVDGGEGGTGAAPLEFSNAVGTPMMEGLVFVHNALVGFNLRDQIKIICAGKINTAFQLIHKIAAGADLCNAARAFMLATGCVQSLKCNTNRCPTGVTTQDKWLRKGLVVEEKYHRVARYHKETVKAAAEVLGATGHDHPSDLLPGHIYQRVSDQKVLPLDQVYQYVDPGCFLTDDPQVSEIYYDAWKRSSAETFERINDF